MNLRISSVVTASLLLGPFLVDPASASPSNDSWTAAPRALVMLRPDAPGRASDFIQVLEAAGGHVSVLIPSQAAWVYASDEVLAKPELRRWIRATHRARIPDSEITRADIQGRRAARSWNHALEISAAMQDGGGRTRGSIPDVRTQPVQPEHQDRALEYERRAPSLLDSNPNLPLGADSSSQSLFMAGSVAVGVWLLEAAGSEYDWSAEEETQSIGGVMAGMDAWVRRGGAGAALSFVFDIHTAVPVSGVPILEDDSNRWVSEALTYAGFPWPSVPYTSYPAYNQAKAYNNWIRDQLRTNWCFSIFIVDSDPAVNAGQLPEGGAAWAYLGGPYVYMSRYSTWAANAFAYYGVIPMHETGHIFYATDEYNFRDEWSGYLYAQDNPNRPQCIMNDTDSSHVCQPTRDQLGWRDLDQDGIIEVLDTPPSLSVDPNPISGQWSGSAAVSIVPSQSPYIRSATIDRIARVELRVDAGPWIEATPNDGAWDGYAEDFQWTTPPLCDGSHVLRARARTRAGSVSEVLTIGFQTSGMGGACGPWVDAPDSVIVSEGMAVEFSVSATDPDGEPVEQLQADVSDLPVPNDASFVRIAGGGTFHWTTTLRDAGVHDVVFTATNSLSGSASTSIHVANVDQPPLLSAPISVDGRVGTQVLFDVAASDPDGDPITYLSVDALPTFATFELRSGGASGQFRWTPVDAQVGTQVVVFRALANLLQASASTTITVGPRPPEPVVTAPDTILAEVGQEVLFLVEVFEPSGELVEIKASGLPPRATFHDNGDWTGLFRWTPEEIDRPGSPYAVSFVATNPAGLTGQASTVLVMKGKPNRPPVADAGGPYHGVVGEAIAFEGGESSDPDGDPLLLTWAFGDGVQAAGTSAAHSYVNEGTYDVVLSASDGMLVDVDSTTAEVAGYLVAEAFLAGRHRTIALAGASSACLRLEPFEASYVNADVDAATLVMHSEGTGDVSEILAESDKSVVPRDLDHDGVEEIGVCFRMADLRRLFSALSGRVESRAFIRGRLSSGAMIQAEVTLTIVAGGVGVSVSPNPLVSRGTITWRTEKPGPIRARLFDVQGRLVRTLYENSEAAAGYHDVELDREGPGGTRLAAGVYFLRVETRGGEQIRRVAVVK